MADKYHFFPGKNRDVNDLDHKAENNQIKLILTKIIMCDLFTWYNYNGIATLQNLLLGSADEKN